MPRVVESDLPPHFSPPIHVHHTSPPPLIPPVAYSPRLGDGEPEFETTEHEDGGLERLGATHAPSRLLSIEDSALVKEHYKTHGRFRFVHHAFLCTTYMIDSALRFSSGHPDTADISANSGILHIPTFPAQQPGMRRPWFSSGIPASQAPYPALPPPTQQTPPASSEVWDDNYLAVLETQDPTSWATGEVES